MRSTQNKGFTRVSALRFLRGMPATSGTTRGPCSLKLNRRLPMWGHKWQQVTVTGVSNPVGSLETAGVPVADRLFGAPAFPAVCRAELSPPGTGTHSTCWALSTSPPVAGCPPGSTKPLLARCLARIWLQPGTVGKGLRAPQRPVRPHTQALGPCSPQDSLTAGGTGWALALPEPQQGQSSHDC